MTQYGFPTLGYLVQSPDSAKAYLGEQARPALLDMYSLRALAGTDIVEKLTHHRFWITLDYSQLQVLQTTGFLAPNIRAYKLYEEDIGN